MVEENTAAFQRHCVVLGCYSINIIRETVYLLPILSERMTGLTCRSPVQCFEIFFCLQSGTANIRPTIIILFGSALAITTIGIL